MDWIRAYMYRCGATYARCARVVSAGPVCHARGGCHAAACDAWTCMVSTPLCHVSRPMGHSAVCVVWSFFPSSTTWYVALADDSRTSSTRATHSWSTVRHPKLTRSTCTIHRHDSSRHNEAVRGASLTAANGRRTNTATRPLRWWRTALS